MGFNLSKGESSFNSLYRDYVYDATNRGYKWTMSKEEFKKITSSNCYYCGKEPSQIRRKNPINEKFIAYLHNGIDRVDNNIGYISSNCVPCCKICNKMKMALPVDIWFEQMEKILKYQQFKFQTTANPSGSETAPVQNQQGIGGGLNNNSSGMM